MGRGGWGRLAFRVVERVVGCILFIVKVIVRLFRVGWFNEGIVRRVVVFRIYIVR